MIPKQKVKLNPSYRPVPQNNFSLFVIGHQATLWERTFREIFPLNKKMTEQVSVVSKRPLEEDEIENFKRPKSAKDLLNAPKIPPFVAVQPHVKSDFSYDFIVS